MAKLNKPKSNHKFGELVYLIGWSSSLSEDEEKTSYEEKNILDARKDAISLLKRHKNKGVVFIDDWVVGVSLGRTEIIEHYKNNTVYHSMYAFDSSGGYREDRIDADTGELIKRKPHRY